MNVNRQKSENDRGLPKPEDRHVPKAEGKKFLYFRLLQTHCALCNIKEVSWRENCFEGNRKTTGKKTNFMAETVISFSFQPKSSLHFKKDETLKKTKS
jgi:hypothetical protein